MSTHHEYAQWDAAYVLGALSPTQRLEFEDHLAGCPRCAEAIGELAAIPGLLGKLSAEDAFAMLNTDADGRYSHSPEPAPAGILAGLAARVRRRRRARTWTIGLVGVAAAAAIAAAIFLPVTLNPPAQQAVTASLQQVALSPISANIQLSTATWCTN
ncbi:MAG: zf-HC2 domain-containing protein, partial [Terrimesophilobacter sp.]